MKIQITKYLNRYDNKGEQLELTENKLTKLFTTFIPGTADKDQNPAFVAGHFYDSSNRKKKNLKSVSILTLDIDSFEGTINELRSLIESELSNLYAIIHSTSSHTSEKPRIRILIPLLRRITVDEYKTLAFNFISSLDKLYSAIDLPASLNGGTLYILPVNPSEETYVPFTLVKTAPQYLNPSKYLNNEDNQYITTSSFLKPANENEELEVTFANLPLDITTDYIRNCLEKYDPSTTDYHSWLQVGLALHHQFKGSKEGKNLWIEWSRRDKRDGYHTRIDKIHDKYPSFEANSPKPVTFASIIKIVKDKKKKSVIHQSGKSKQHSGNSFIVPLDVGVWLELTDKLKPKPTLNNFKIMLENYNVKFLFDIIFKKVQFYRDGELVDERLEGNLDLNTYIKYLCVSNDMNNKISVEESVRFIANSNRTNSWLKLIEQHSSKPTDNFDRLCNSITVLPQYEEIKRIYLKKWLLQMIHMSCLNDQPTPKLARYVLVFQSKEKVGKTTWFQHLVHGDYHNYIAENITLDVNDSMQVKGCLEKVMVELGEIDATLKKSPLPQLKGFLTKAVDQLNIKYLADHAVYRRNTTFFGSVNEVDFLENGEGNTRFLIIPVLKCDAFHKINMFDLYAELLEEARNGAGFLLTDEEEALQSEINKSFCYRESFEDKLEEIFDLENKGDKTEWQFYTATKLLEMFGMNINNIRQSTRNKLGKILNGYNFIRCSRRGWKMPPKRNQVEGF